MLAANIANTLTLIQKINSNKTWKWWNKIWKWWNTTHPTTHPSKHKNKVMSIFHVPIKTSTQYNNATLYAVPRSTQFREERWRRHKVTADVWKSPHVELSIHQSKNTSFSHCQQRHSPLRHAPGGLFVNRPPHKLNAHVWLYDYDFLCSDRHAWGGMMSLKTTPQCWRYM